MTLAARRPESSEAPGWTPDSWREFPSAQQPEWDPEELRVAAAELTKLPTLVRPSEVRRLLSLLANAQRGDAFVVQSGDCAESFDDVGTSHVTRRARLITELSDLFAAETAVPAVNVGRIAGQFAKPRSEEFENVGGQRLATFRGHMVNRPEPDGDARRPDARRMLEAYYRSAATLNLIRAIDAPNRLAGPLWASRESLILPYERATLRRDDSSGQWYLTSTHFPWVGERTRALDGAHIEMMRGVANPVAVKLGPSTAPEGAIALCERLNPSRIAGRLTFITRMGPERVRQVLPSLVTAVADEGHGVGWVCDPMHGNTVLTSAGLKTRRMADMLAEFDGWIEVLAALGVPPAGVHIECTPDAVRECLDPSADEATAVDGREYETLCDPRLNAAQAHAVIGHVAARYRSLQRNWQ